MLRLFVPSLPWRSSLRVRGLLTISKSRANPPSHRRQTSKVSMLEELPSHHREGEWTHTAGPSGTFAHRHSGPRCSILVASVNHNLPTYPRDGYRFGVKPNPEPEQSESSRVSSSNDTKGIKMMTYITRGRRGIMAANARLCEDNKIQSRRRLAFLGAASRVCMSISPACPFNPS